MRAWFLAWPIGRGARCGCTGKRTGRTGTAAAPSRAAKTGWLTSSSRKPTSVALRRSVERGVSYGSERWQRKTIAALGLESTLRPRGRPRKSKKEGLTPLSPANTASANARTRRHVLSAPGVGPPAPRQERRVRLQNPQVLWIRLSKLNNKLGHLVRRASIDRDLPTSSVVGSAMVRSEIPWLGSTR